MNKKIYLVMVLCVFFSLTHLTKADVLLHWSFDGPPGQELISATDHVSTTSLKMFNNPNIMGYIAYGKPNPWFNTGGTSAEFINDRVHKNHGAALATTDTGENTTLDLSTLDAFTIEFFLCSYGLNDCVLVGKGGGEGKYSIELLYGGEIRFTINSDSGSISTEPGTVRHSAWYHIAAVFDQKDNQSPMKLYVNGILVSAGGATQNVRDSINSFCVGTHLDRNDDPPKHHSNTNKFSGRLDELRISDTPLVPNEFLLNVIPTKARYPYPENQAEQCSKTTHLKWHPAKGVTSHRIYFGTNPNNLSLIAEVGPDVNRLINKQLGGMLEADTTYYWRVDSEADSDSAQSDSDLRYEFFDEGKGEIWTFTTQGDRVDGGYLRWLLHLGQNPNDSPLTDYRSCYKIRRLVEDANVMPKPGEIYKFDDQYRPWDCPSNRDMLIWTPQYSTTGFFESYGLEERRIHYYHVYLISPEKHQARLNFWSFGGLRVWCNGEPLLEAGGGAYNSRERYHDFVLEEGVNSMTFEVGAEIRIGIEYDYHCHYLGVRITDCNDYAFTDVTYSLTPPLPEMDVLVKRQLPDEYGSNDICNVTLEVTVESEAEPNDLTVIEYIPEGLTVADAGGGRVVGNSISWALDPNQASSLSISYSLDVPPGHSGIVPFLGYVYHDQRLAIIVGDEAVFEELPCSPADMAAEIDTIEIDTRDYIYGENVTIEDIGEEFSGLRVSPDGGWAQYEFDITHPDRYQILVEYSEYWTMFHHGADLVLSIDDEKSIQTTLFPTLHSTVRGNHVNYSRGPLVADRHAQWIAGVVDLTEGNHTLNLLMQPLDIPNEEKDFSSDGRPVINRITLINYPALSVPAIAEPHHLDSYEHPPARLVHDRDVKRLSDGRVETKFYGTFYSLSQGNEIYFPQGYVRPKPGEDTSRFEIVSFEPKVFHLWTEGEQDFVLTVRSKEPLPEDYSELVVVWLQGTPSCPAIKPYLFTTGQKYIILPPYKNPEFDWSNWALLGNVHYHSSRIKVDMTDPPNAFVPDRGNLGFYEGRYSRSLGDFFRDQFAAGKLPSVDQIFAQRGWDYNNRLGSHGQMTWGNIWIEIMGSLYWRDIPEQAEAVVQRISENMVFYPVSIRWDWARPYYLPNWSFDTVGGKYTLAAHVRAAQEGLIDDDEQFRILHNLVLPILNSYWDELRVTGTLVQDANEGDTSVYFDRPFYGKTGSPIDGFDTLGTGYVKIGGEPHPRTQIGGNNEIRLATPLSKTYPKGTPVSSWAYREDFELEGRDLRSLVTIAAASRDWAVIDEVTHSVSEILEKQHVFLSDGSFRNQPGSYGTGNDYYRIPIILRRFFGEQAVAEISSEVWQKLHNGLIYTCQFPFSNGRVPALTATGSDNQQNRSYFFGLELLGELFPDDQENLMRYRRIAEQEALRIPGERIDNENFVIHGWGYAMLRSENGSWDRGMEALLASKFLVSDPGDKVSSDCLGIVVYGLGAILTPRYGSAFRDKPPYANQVMVDNDCDPQNNRHYGSFWHFDGRKELPCAVAHTGDGIDSSDLPFRKSRWCIQFPEYLFDAFFIEAKDGSEHDYDWCLINMGNLEVVEPIGLSWSNYDATLSDYWPVNEGAGMVAYKYKGRVQSPGKIVADWIFTNGSWDWEDHTDETLLRYPPQHSGKLRLIMSDNGEDHLVKAEIGYPDTPNQFQANSQDILTIHKNGNAHVFVDTLETIAVDEEVYVRDVSVIEKGNHQQRLVKITTAEGEDWIYLSGHWGARQDGDQPVHGIATDADIVVWRVVNNAIKRVYIAGGSYAETPHGSWDFGSTGNHYIGYGI